MSGCGWNIMDIYHLYHHHNEEETYTALLWMETIDDLLPKERNNSLHPLRGMNE